MIDVSQLPFCQLTVQSLLAGVDSNKHMESQVSKLDEIYSNLIIHHKFDVVALTETWLNMSHCDRDVNVDNYTHFRKDRTTGRGGGILVYVLSDIPCVRRYDLEQNIVACEMVWLQLVYGTCKILFGTCYCPLGQNAEESSLFISDVQSALDLIYCENPECIILTGDFNDRSTSFYEEHPTSELGVKLRDMVVQNNLFQLISEPTHFTDNSAYILDLIITDSPGYVTDSGVLPPYVNSTIPQFTQDLP